MRQTQHNLIITLVVLVLMAFQWVGQPAQAASLRDLIKRQPELYMPSQLTRGEQASFVIRGKAGNGVKVIVSSWNQGLTLPDGRALAVGKPALEATGQIPENGVLKLTVDVPVDASGLDEHSYVAAISWSPEDPNTVEVAQVIASSGIPTNENTLVVADRPDPGSMMVTPGDPSIGSLMRSVNQINEVSGDDRKKALLYDGAINRKRLLDQNLSKPMPMQ